MKSLEHLFTEISKTHLNIPTLKLRMSDALDFHELAIWQIRNALHAAYTAGTGLMLAEEEPSDNPRTRFDNYEIQPCRQYIDIDDPNLSFVEPCNPFEAHFWTLYGHTRGEGVQAIGDFGTRDHAEGVFAKITGQPYASSKHISRKC